MRIGAVELRRVKKVYTKFKSNTEEPATLLGGQVFLQGSKREGTVTQLGYLDGRAQRH